MVVKAFSEIRARAEARKGKEAIEKRLPNKLQLGAD